MPWVAPAEVGRPPRPAASTAFSTCGDGPLARRGGRRGGRAEVSRLQPEALEEAQVAVRHRAQDAIPDRSSLHRPDELSVTRGCTSGPASTTSAGMGPIEAMTRAAWQPKMPPEAPRVGGDDVDVPPMRSQAAAWCVPQKRSLAKSPVTSTPKDSR